MRIQIRKGVFETNSSSVHTLTICEVNEFDEWERGILILDDEQSSFVPISVARESYEKDMEEIRAAGEKAYDEDSIQNDGILDEEADFRSWCRENGYETYDQWTNRDYLEAYEEHFTSPSGDKMVVFGVYGHD